MARRNEGLTDQVNARVRPEEAQMLRDIAGQLGLNKNRAVRWLLRYGYQHILTTIDHTQCPKDSPCAAAARGLEPPKVKQRMPKGTHDPSATGDTKWQQPGIT